MRITGRILPILFCFILILPAHAQKWQKYLNKVDAKYSIGDYKKAGKFNEKLRKKSLKKLGADNPYLIDYYINRARIDNAIGELSEFKSELNLAILMSAKYYGDNSVPHALKLLKIADIYSQYGNYIKASAIADKARDILKESGKYSGQFKIYCDFVLMKIAGGKGFYSQAAETGVAIRDLMQNSLNAKVISYNPQTKVEQQSKPSKDEKEQRETDYCFLISYIPYCYGARGDFERADSAFNAAEQWIRKKEGRITLQYSVFLFFRAEIEDLRGDWKNSRGDYRNAYLNLKTKMKSAYYLTYIAHEKLIENYVKIDRDTRANNEFLSYDKAVRKNFSRNSIYKIKADLLDMKLNPENQSDRTQEKYIASILEVNFLPEFHPFREKVLDYLILNQTRQRKYKSSLYYFDKLLVVEDSLYGDNAPKYHITKVKLGSFYMDYTNNISDARDIDENSFKNVILKEFSEQTPMIAGFYRFASNVDFEFDNFKDAVINMQKSLSLIKSKFGDESVEYGNAVDHMSDLYIDVSKFNLAKSYIDTAIDILKHEAEDAEKTLYASSLQTQARLLRMQGEYDDAIKIIKQAQRQIKKSDVDDYADFKGLETLAEIDLRLGKYSSTEDLLTQAIAQKEDIFGEDSRFLIQPLLRYGDLLITNGDYPNAEKNITRATDIASKIYGQRSSRFAECLIEEAKLHLALGDFEEGEKNAKSAYEIQKNVFNNDNITVANTLSLLGEISFYRGDELKTVEDYFLQAETVIIKLAGSDNPVFADNLKNLGIIYLAKNQYQRALNVLRQSKIIWQKKAGKRHNINTADIDVLVGDVYYGMRDYQNAKSNYEDAQKLYRKFFNKSHPKYVKTLSKLSKVSFMMGDTRDAKNYIEQALDNYLQFINEYFPTLSERGKAQFWNTIKPDFEYYNTLALRLNSQFPDMIGTLYNNALATKALLLNSSIKIRERILNSSDTTLRKLYFEWKDKNEILANALSMSPEEQQEEGINPDRLKSEIEDIEKVLSSHTTGFANVYGKKIITWENVKSSLAPNEAAVEIIRFRYFNQNFTDSVIYLGVYVKPDSKIPQYFIYRDGRDMEKKYFASYRNAIKFKLSDALSYAHYWKPFEEAFGQSTTIYLSPDGVFNQINLEAIPTPDGKYVLDNSNIILVNNTKDLFIQRAQSATAANKKTATLVGNPKFYASARDMKSIIAQGGNPVNELPATEIEIKDVGNILSKDGWKTKDYLEDSATERNIKKINDPDIFHIATHGFFKTDKPITNELEGMQLSNYEALENPLLRTGLLLTGAGDLLSTTTFNYNLESGILTAYEAMNLNLDNTQLVVLSACETGLGDVEVGEGVYGLQRAFLVAGAKTLIMSLFKVSDEVTQQLMVKFYRKWLNTGNERLAFVDAKKEIRNEYKYPFYWGSFVMIGLDK